MHDDRGSSSSNINFIKMFVILVGCHFHCCRFVFITMDVRWAHFSLPLTSFQLVPLYLTSFICVQRWGWVFSLFFPLPVSCVLWWSVKVNTSTELFKRILFCCSCFLFAFLFSCFLFRKLLYISILNPNQIPIPIPHILHAMHAVQRTYISWKVLLLP